MSFIRKPESELKALLPIDVEIKSMNEYKANDGPCIAQNHDVQMAINKLIKNPRVVTRVHVMRSVPDDLRAKCENHQHTLLNRLNQKLETEFFDGPLSYKIAEGVMPAEFYYLDHTWPPKDKNYDIHFVCGFCAAEQEENWLEAAGEAACS